MHATFKFGLERPFFIDKQMNINYGDYISLLLLMETCKISGEGTGLLRLHSTYRHDLKIYSSDEGRVQV